ncbi:IS1634 family transposase [Bradyrhizobium sp.]|uniref:IS1634 family transposase n=1 Tax=Bradyrhizobium sp. TaxID=376 RepID=UPI00239464A8|nr:IS1634 family transposase [Bradyrhizobium sp.]MDE2379363.1 IS1634 family transposase [Bradyrhizobium sp.]
MFLRENRRFKDGKHHRYWNIVENRRCAGGKVVQRQVLYLGEINDSQVAGWSRAIEAFDEDAQRYKQLSLFPADKTMPQEAAGHGVQVRLDAMQLHRPRQWGACWLANHLYDELQLDAFWSRHLPASRKGRDWQKILQTLVCYRLIDPGSEWRLHRQWFEQSAMADLLGADFALAAKNGLYGCLDKILPHKQELFSHLRQRWQDLFGARFEVLLYDLTSTYFESPPPDDETDKRRYGYSRDKRSDCVQIVIALVVTPDGFPIAYEVLPGNTADSTTLRGFLQKIEAQYGKAERIWVMDRGIPTEAVLAEMRQADPPVYYLVGTPKGRLSTLEKALLDKPWKTVRQGVDVKLLPQEQETYVFAQSHARIHKERAMRQRKLRWLWARLQQIVGMTLTRKELLMKLGAARAKAPAAWRLLDIDIPDSGTAFIFKLNRNKLRAARRREGRYLLRTNLNGRDPADLWQFYIQLTEIEAAFKNLKDDLQLRPIYHQLEHRIEAHIFVAFIAYCLQVTLRARLKTLAPGLTPRAVLDKMAAIQMLDVHFPTTDRRILVLTRYTEPNADQKLLLRQLKLELPPQPPPRLTTAPPAVRYPAPAL